MNSVLYFSRCCFCFAWVGVTLLLLILTRFTWRSYISVIFLVNRGSWWDVCELIFASPAGYGEFAFSLSAGVSFQSGLLWGSMFFALVEILVEDIMVTFLGCGRVGFSWYFINFVILFFLLGKCYIICRWYSSYIKSPKMVACLWCRINVSVSFSFLWCYCFLVLLGVKFSVAGSAFKGVNGVFQLLVGALFLSSCW